MWVEETSQLNEGFIKEYNEDRDIGYFIEAEIQYPEKLHELHNDVPFLPERKKIKKIEKLIANLLDKKEYVIQRRNLKEALNHGLVLKKWIKFLDFEKDFFMLMNYAVFERTMENVRKYRDIKFVTTDERRNYLVSNYHTTNVYSENLLAIEIKNNNFFLNKPVYLGLPILELLKTVMYDFWYDYVKPKYKKKKAKLCYMEIYSFTVYIIT